mmetsp:Transcript_99573/g.249645  ORF Transcript_99573/g.249645 Transcript_99573/m.249645 type:complete len:206 (+) Transcript_99573:1006-1623(+)
MRRRRGNPELSPALPTARLCSVADRPRTLGGLQDLPCLGGRLPCAARPRRLGRTGPAHLHGREQGGLVGRISLAEGGLRLPGPKPGRGPLRMARPAGAPNTQAALHLSGGWLPELLRLGQIIRAALLRPPGEQRDVLRRRRRPQRGPPRGGAQVQQKDGGALREVQVEIVLVWRLWRARGGAKPVRQRGFPTRLLRSGLLEAVGV